MKNYLHLVLTFAFFSFTDPGIAQISMSYPLENCVFQRDQNNRSVIYFAGNFSEFMDVIEVKLSPVREGWGQPSDWIGIVHQPKNGYYSASIEWVGGWYRIEVRGRKGNDVVGTTSVNRVGIGEVFLIAGQSNGQGFLNNGASSANDERVIHADYDGSFGPNAPLPYPNFSHLQANDVISPRGKSGWIWAPLGDALASRLNVPVLFYNVAWDGSGVQAWQQSINGTGYSVYVPGLPFTPTGMPYGNLRNVMQNYVSITGLRSVLWFQGEADNDGGTSQNTYYSTLESLINHTRNEFKHNLSWVISRTSYTVRSGTASRITNAQNQIIQNVPNVFSGPETDLVQIPRPDGYHFHGDGLFAAAVAWNASLNSDFFARSQPQKAKAPLHIVPVCQNNQITLFSEGNLNRHRWSNGSNNAEITPGEGEYQLAAFDQDGNYRFSPRIKVPGNIGSITPPTISSQGIAEVCEGGSLTLRSSSAMNPMWSTGQNGQEIQISSPGDYTVSIENAIGCRSTSNTFTVARSNKTLPVPPTVVASKETEFCEGGEVQLSANTGSNTFWSNGVNSQNNTVVKQTGEYTARTRDTEGCYSNPSNKISVKVNPLPAKPNISQNGSTTFCSGGEVTLRSSYEQGNVWSNSTNSREIVVRQGGDYSVSVTDEKGCRNTSDPIKVTVNPLPAAPVISSTRPLSFCQGDYTTLISTPQHIIVWNNGSNNREINVNSNGEYWAEAVDQNGCKSTTSNKLTVQANPLPEKPTITPLGNTTFCENAQVELEAPESSGYVWSNGEAQRRVVIKTATEVHLRTVNEFGCQSPRSDGIATRTLGIPTPPVISANGPTDICDNQSVVLTAAGAAPFLWSNEATTPSVTIGEAGLFFARTVGSNGCFSNPSNQIEIITRETPGIPAIEKSGNYSLKIANHRDGVQYHWQYESQVADSDQSQFIRMNQSGKYSAQSFIRYSETLTCTSEFSTALAFVIEPNGEKINVFPNPVQGTKVWIEASRPLTNATVTLYSAHGIEIGKLKFSQLQVPVEFEIPPGASGVLIIKVVADFFKDSKQLVILN